MFAVSRTTPGRSKRTAAVGRTAATLTVTAALLAFGFTAAPVQAASAATAVNDATSLIAAFATGGTVTLDADIDVWPFVLQVTPDKPVTLDLNGRRLSSIAPFSFEPGIRVPAGAQLIIVDRGTGGSLEATGGHNSAGIGGGHGEDGGTVTIQGGSVTATGGTGGAGIGGGVGAGVGGGGGTTTITGGTVTATGGNNGSGIGGGVGVSGGGGTTTITGGTVTATGGINASGIGGGGNGAGGVVSITGGAVTANGGANGRAIGAGGVGGVGGNLTIGSGAQVTVSASANAAVSGSLENNGSLTITSGSYLDIPAGTTVQNSGIISGAGAITNAGAIVNTGSILVSVSANNFELTFDTTVGPGTTPVAIAPLRVYASTLGAAQLTLPAPTPISHYSFSSWSTDAARTVAMTTTTALTGDLTLYGTWTLDRHVVSFDAQDGSAVTSTTTDHGTTIPAPTPTRTGHTFTGWYTTATGGTAWDFNNTVTSNIDLYAQWTPDHHEATFHQQGGSTVAPITTDYGTTITEPTAPTRTGHTFTGWYTTATGGTKWNFTTTVTSDIDLYAQWTPDHHEATFHPQGGSTVAPITTDYGTTITAPTPTYTGHTFTGWYTAATGGTKWDSTNTVTSNIDLYAQWTLDRHVATFHPQGGSAVAPVTTDYGTPIAEPTASTRTGHTFTGWYTAATGGTAWDFTTTVTSDIDLYARWTPDPHLISFDAQDGSAIAPVTTGYGTPITEPSAPSRTGYTFSGWYTAATGGTKWNFADAVTGDVALFAQWAVVSVVTPPTSTPTPTPTPTPTLAPPVTPGVTPSATPTVTPASADPKLASTGYDGSAAGLGALVLLVAGLAAMIVRRRRTSAA